MSTAQQTVTAVVALPRVNLLPPEIAEQVKFKRVQAGLGAGVVAALGLAGAAFVVANGQVSSAQDDLDAQQARNRTLTAQEAQYAEVPVVYAQVDAAQARLAQAMGREIRWSYVLNDLSLATPSKVWLTSMTFAANTDDAAVGGAAAAPASDTYLQPGIGTVTFEGKGYRHNDVASWLLALGREPGLDQPYFTSSKVEQIGDQDSVTFTSQATITEDALSGRWTDEAGS
jgi:Tfp pilus assembly protein PilN